MTVTMKMMMTKSCTPTGTKQPGVCRTKECKPLSKKNREAKQCSFRVQPMFLVQTKALKLLGLQISLPDLIVCGVPGVC